MILLNLLLFSKSKIMKRKLNTVFLLVILSLTGIIMFQVYWTINAYKVNKRKFDGDVDLAMQRAMDDCKKDYFDSIRTVLVKRLSPPETVIKVDTIHEKDTINVMLNITLLDKQGNSGPLYSITTPQLDFYRKKISHKATLPEVLTEASFYSPALMNDFTLFLGMQDIKAYPKQLADFTTYENTHLNIPADTMMKLQRGMDNTIYGFPKNYKLADSLKLTGYLRAELDKMNISSPFMLYFSRQNSSPTKLNAHYSETNEYSYKYHGFKVFNIIGPEFFTRAVFRNPQYVIIKSMSITLLLSALLIILAIYCFNYVIKTILEQKKLAELKDDFINNMTHELKTPIATMTVAIEGLQKFNALNDPEKTQRYLQTSRNELNRLNDIVSKVLNVAAYENKEINLVKEKVDIDELVQDVITTEKLKTDKKLI